MNNEEYNKYMHIVDQYYTKNIAPAAPNVVKLIVKDAIPAIDYARSKMKALLAKDSDYSIWEFLILCSQVHAIDEVSTDAAIAFTSLIDNEEDYSCPHAMDCTISKDSSYSWNSHYSSKYKEWSDDDDEGEDGCFLTTACVEHLGKEDNCYELQILRWYRDNYMLSSSDENRDLVRTYYEMGPLVVAEINKRADKDDILQEIYDELVTPCMKMIIKSAALTSEEDAKTYHDLMEQIKNHYKRYTEQLYRKLFE